MLAVPRQPWAPLSVELPTIDSFSEDLLAQWDKSYAELVRPAAALVAAPTPPLAATSIASRDDSITAPATTNTRMTIPPTRTTVAKNQLKKRQSLPSDLLRRSSAFLKTKWAHWRWSVQPPGSRASATDDDAASLVPSTLDLALDAPTSTTLRTPITVAINTTITMPVHRKPSHPAFNAHLLQPPIISQFPPKPLQYSPVVMIDAPPQNTALPTLPPLPPPSPPPDHTSPHARPRSLLHKLSMPLLNRP
ncbi:hypothetical protein BC940DRAFT_331420 [Gongronella butleri]|nr:hypothetical protein BC940DRAFT_331420 [Gongronella butleri]